MILFSSVRTLKIHHTPNALKMTFSCILHFTIWHMTAYFRLIKIVRCIRYIYAISGCVTDRVVVVIYCSFRDIFSHLDTTIYPATHHGFKNLYWNRWLCHSLVIITHWTIPIPLRKDDCISVRCRMRTLYAPHLNRCFACIVMQCGLYIVQYTKLTAHSAHTYLASELMYFCTESLF